MPGFKGGDENINRKGRKKGSPNKTTEEARKIFMDVLAGQVPRINTALEEIYKKDKLKFLYIVQKMLPYFVAKKMDITSDGEQLTGFKVEIVKDANPDKTK